MKWYISFDILAAANGIVKEHLPPFFVNQGPFKPNSKDVICSWELSSKFKSLSKYYILCFDITFSHMKDARGAIWQGDLRLSMYSTTHESSVAMVPTEYFLLINNHTHTQSKKT